MTRIHRHQKPQVRPVWEAGTSATAVASRLSWVLLLLLLSLAVCAAGDRPGPFTFVYGLDRGGTLADLQHFGVNSLYMDLQPDELEDLTLVREQVREAAAAGYHVIVGLPTTELGRYRVSPYSEQYRNAATELIHRVILQLRDETGISAWATGHYLEKHLSYDDRDFRQFLQDRYGSLERLNRMWETSFSLWGAVDQETALNADPDMPFGIGRAAVDVADYRHFAFGAVMSHWAETVKSLDESRPLMTGCVTLYRSLPAIPETYDIIAVSLPPDVIKPSAERYGDGLTHNVDGIDLARRGGRFEVIPVLRVPLPHEPGYSRGLRDWILAADLHGARGIAIENWQRYVQYPEIAARSVRLLNETWPLVDFRGEPQPPVAVLYSPYAEGVQVVGQPVYGHLKGFGSGTPGELMAGLRQGTCFGLTDYLAVEDLGRVNLSRYGLIIAPAALSLNESQSQLLSDYVRAGGALIADLGFGLHHTGTWLRLPGPGWGLFGISELRPGEARAGDLTLSGSMDEFPHLSHGMKTTGTFRAVVGGSGGGPRTYQAGTYSVSSYTAYALVMQGALGLAVLRTDTSGDQGPAIAGLICNRYGRGLGLFATHQLYSHWPLSDRVSTALHYDLIRRQASCELVDGPFLRSDVAISLEQDRVRLFNCSDRQAVHSVALYGQGDRLIEGVVTVNHAAYGGQPQRQFFEAHVPSHSIRNLRLTGITAQPYEAHVSVVIADCSEPLVRLVAAGPGARPAPTRENPHQFQRPEAAVRVRFAVRDDGTYAVADGSRHQVTIRPDRGNSRTLEVVASQGQISFTADIYRDQITISPMH